jgi:hypothetical protein
MRQIKTRATENFISSLFSHCRDLGVMHQCKNHAKPVGNRPVQEVYAGARHHGCNKAAVVAPRGFTKGAYTLARSVGVDLYDSASLREWIRRIHPIERDIQPIERRIHPIERKWRTVDLDSKTMHQKGETVMDSGMMKHTISLGTDDVGETVSFTAKKLGTVKANGGIEKGDMDWTYYRLPDHTYRLLIDDGEVKMLLPSNMGEAFRRGEPTDYGRWTLEELQAQGEYGRAFGILMEKHPETRKQRGIRDLD